MIGGLNGAYLPEHASAETLSVDVLCLETGDVRGVVGDELLLGGVVRVAGHVGQVLEDL